MNSQPKFHDTDLTVECLEDRMMLSTVDVIASGDTGMEEFRVSLNGAELGRSTVTQQLQTYTFEISTPFTADQIRIDFINDAYDPGQGLDRNLRVDAIVVDGQRFETEDPSVYSTGTWRAEDGVVPGFGRGELLHSNGSFEYASDSGSQIEIVARGDEGTEQFALIVQGVRVATFDASTSDQTFTYTDSRELTADDIQIRFLNDEFDPDNGVDSNLFVDFIRVNGETLQTEDPSVFSNGTWRPEDGVVPGNGRGQYLNTNGVFRYSTIGTTRVVVAAKGAEGTEQFRLVVDGEVIATTNVFTGEAFFEYDVAGDVRPEDVRVEFFNDQYDPANGIDTDLTVSSVFINGQAYSTDSNTVFSTGTYSTDGLAPGFGRGRTLHTNGYFQFNAIADTARYRVTFDGTWSPQTHPNGAFPGGGHFSGLIGATHNEFVDFWSVGQRATAGIEEVAELGSKNQLTDEVNAAINASNADQVLSGGGITLAPDSVSLEFDVNANVSLVTLVSMVAPSPDWFVGVDSLPLINNDGWIGSQTISLVVYDSGTDDGTGFTSADIDNQNGTITRLSDSPLANAGPVGTFRFERIG